MRLVEAFAEGEQLLEAAARHRLEGVVTKRRASPYRSGPTGTGARSKRRAGAKPTAYNAQGYEKTAYDSYTLNGVTAKKNNGAIAVQFGGCDGELNCLPIEKGWNYRVRLYHPRAEILNGTWKYPEPWPADGSGSLALQ